MGTKTVFRKEYLARENIGFNNFLTKSTNRLYRSYLKKHQSHTLQAKYGPKRFITIKSFKPQDNDPVR